MTERLERTIVSAPLTIMWFRQDLRLRDNPALSAATAENGPVLPVYILDDENAGDWKMGAASRWWLHHSLKRLNEALDGRLRVLRGDALAELLKLCDSLSVARVVWNRCYEPWRLHRDHRIVEALRERGIESEEFNGSLLWDPRESCKADGTPYLVFTPFYRNLSRYWPSGALTPVPDLREMKMAECDQPANRIDRLELLPTVHWYGGFEETWRPGEAGAHERLEAFVENAVADYHERRDFPADASVSALSPHLHFGEIGPLRVWQAVQDANAGDGGGRIDGDDGVDIVHGGDGIRGGDSGRGGGHGPGRGGGLDRDNAHGGDGADAWIRQLYWREFSYHLLYHFPTLCDSNLKPGFDHFPWRDDPELLRRWQQGATGIPFVDAGMRELWTTGTMHNRLRMVTASFLTKNLLIHWLHGARWFWDCLVDADLANNSFGWQWVAGCGADAAPYFRVFNPVLQSRKFDPSGTYLRRWLPELAGLSDRRIHAPWEAAARELGNAGVTLGTTYPAPIVDLRASRERALAAWRTVRGSPG